MYLDANCNGSFLKKILYSTLDEKLNNFMPVTLTFSMAIIFFLKKSAIFNTLSNILNIIEQVYYVYTSYTIISGRPPLTPIPQLNIYLFIAFASCLLF